MANGPGRGPGHLAQPVVVLVRVEPAAWPRGAAGAGPGQRLGFSQERLDRFTCGLGGNWLICCWFAEVRGFTALATKPPPTTPCGAFRNDTGAALEICADKRFLA
jgi:hypothetical protein